MIRRALVRVLRVRVTLAVVAGLVLVGVGYRAGLVPERSYGVVFVALFAFLGLRSEPGTSIRMSPALATAYVVPLIGAESRIELRAAAVSVATCLFVGEIISRSRAEMVEALRKSRRSAAAFRTVAAASASLHRLEPESVLDAVVDAVIDLGYDGANLVVVDEDTEQFALIHRRGLSLELGTEWQPIGTGMTATVRQTGTALVVEDYESWEHSIEHYRHRGVRTLIGVPTVIGSAIVGVLVASTRSPRPVHTSDVEALESLSLLAGAALANVERYETQRSIAVEQSRAALTDELTGLANRRHADRVLSRVVPGASLAMIDVDEFSKVNERLGHAGGDCVLTSIADHLAGGLRDDDFVARFGGEEFLLILPGRDLASAAGVVERLAESWRATTPETTFSAGVAHYVRGDVGAALGLADGALYAAKRGGRDRVVTAPTPPDG